MTEHAWSQEQIAAYLAGGLNAEEIERLEAHARDCQECKTALESFRRLDRGLNSLFEMGKPGPELEDRALFALRMGPARKPIREGWQQRLLIAATAAVVMTAGGVVASYVDKLPDPENLSGWGFAKSNVVREGADGSIGQQLAITGLPNDLPLDGRFAGFLTNEILGVDAKLPATVQYADEVINKEVLKTNVDVTLKELDTIRTRNSTLEDRVNVNSIHGFQGLGNQLDGTAQWGDHVGNGNFYGLGYYPQQRAEIVRGTGRIHTTDTTKFMKPRSDVNSNGLPDFDPQKLGEGFSDQIIADGSIKGINPNSLPQYYGMPTNLGVGVPTNGRAEIPVNGKRDSEENAQWGRPANRPGKDIASAFRPGDHKPDVSKLSEPKQVFKVVVEGNAVTADRVVAGAVMFDPIAKPESPALPGASAPTPLQPPAAPNAEPPVRNNVVIRTGEIEFEVDSFDSSAATVTKLVAGIKGAFVATTNSEKLTNGKMKGSITVRVPPEQLDGLLLDLKREVSKGGELRGSRIGSQDITKQYTDLESRLKAAKVMQERFLQIIKEAKGDIKSLVEAEKELGTWRTKIEEFEGELRYYANQVALSTLTITLTEKEIKAAATMTESERVQAGVEVEDVEKADRELKAAVVEAKGRITKSDMKQLSAGQYNATLNFEVAPEAAGVLRDRLKQIGKLARLEIDRVQQPEGTLTKNAKVQRGDTMFLVQLYNLANIAPREVAVIHVAVLDVPTAYRTLRETAAKTTGRVLAAQLNEQDQHNFGAQFDFEVRRTDEGTLRASVDNLGEVLTRLVSRAPESENVTDSKVLYRTTLLAANQLKPRERFILNLEVADVDQLAVTFGVQASGVEANGVKGRQIDSQISRDKSGKVTAKLVYEVPLVAATGLVERFKSAGAVNVLQEIPDPQVPQGKYSTARLEITLTNVERIVGDDEAVWPNVKRGLSNSVTVLLKSVKWLVFGLCVVLPWVVISYVGFKLLRRLILPNRTVVSAPPPTTPSATSS